jgi:isocitrate/isopropylmalate dehydrogenase
VHGSAPDIAGQGIANPSSVLLASCLMLEHLGRPEIAGRIRGALQATLTEGKVLTPDLGGTATTEKFGDTVIDKLGEAPTEA